MGSNLKRKNLLLVEQILSFKSLSHCRKRFKESGRVASFENGTILIKPTF